MLYKNVPISGPFIIEKALQFAKALGYDEFRGSNDGFKNLREDTELWQTSGPPVSQKKTCATNHKDNQILCNPPIQGYGAGEGTPSLIVVEVQEDHRLLEMGTWGISKEQIKAYFTAIPIPIS
ncbi:hypothetical protein AVEN_141167-1 [Araneus ventricosus]|uniref:Uncharacterized protein n=1 Tax=Araneus ventricosus TaxID=182803 RepID=A0A4Y2VBC0_ARAVE|nr:hypothetical protein AVEN_141167-1 [Araneus ventricosus]